jgi:hypothetical protein
MIDGKDEERGRKIACNWGWRRGDEKRRASKVGLLLTSGFGRTLLLEGHWLEYYLKKRIEVEKNNISSHELL